MFDPGDSGPFHTTLVPDLRSCRVLPVERPGKGRHCLEIVSPQLNITVVLRPSISEETDLWLAALLCWQQTPPSGTKTPTARSGNGSGTSQQRTEVVRRPSATGLRDAAVIKVGKVMLWDKGFTTSPRNIVKRPSTRDLRATQTSWKKVSCILHDNGELKLMTENDVAVLSIIELPQLSRSAIQQLDRTVLEEKYCIGIFPIYAPTSTHLSLFRPVYISLESRLLFEVWFVLLRAFAVPDVYGLDPANGGQVYEVTDLNAEPPGEVFRVEKSITVRVTEAKIKSRTLDGVQQPERERHHSKHADHDPVIGNYLAEVILDGEVRARTTTKMDTKNPFWREDCNFTDLPASLPYLSVVLKRVDGNPESFSHQLQATLGLPKTGHLTEVLCGSVDIHLHELDRGKDHEQWLPVYDERKQSIGTMLVKVQHDEHVVLFSKDYQPLSELLHRVGSTLTAQINEAMQGNYLRALAHIFLNIFQVSGKATEWLTSMVEDEFDGIETQATMRKPRFSRRLQSTDSIESISDREQIVRDTGKVLQGEANLLFRGNSLLTQALEFHMRRLGKEYLEETLAEKIREINEANPNCEVDPGKLQHGEDMHTHWNRLINVTTEVWGCIVASANRLPAELREIFKYIRAVAEDRYGGYLRSVTYTSVSGFLFLRFICPAILNPKIWGLLRDHPRPRAQRTLTLVAKGLQALANLSTIGKKETWMEPMNRFLSAQKQSVRDFLDAVCAIPTEKHINVIVPASYSTPITILGRLSPLAREGFPSLPYLVDHARNFAALVKLWTSQHPDYDAPYTGDLLEFHRHCVRLHRRAEDCFARIESLRSAAETASLAAEEQMSLSDAIERVSLGGDAYNPSSPFSSSSQFFSNNNSTNWMDGIGNPPGSSGSDVIDSSLASGHGAAKTGASRDAYAMQSRQVSKSSDVSASSASGSGAGGTVRGLRNGMHPRKFLSGFIRKTRTGSPEQHGTSPPVPPPVVGSPFGGTPAKEKQKERVREQEKEKLRDNKGREKAQQQQQAKDTTNRSGGRVGGQRERAASGANARARNGFDGSSPSES